MAEIDSTTAANGGKQAALAPGAANDAGELSLEALAQGILDRKIRPRTADLRRLAEAVLAGGAKRKKAKSSDGDGKKKNKAGKKDGKKKKLAKIPGQKDGK